MSIADKILNLLRSKGGGFTEAKIASIIKEPRQDVFECLVNLRYEGLVATRSVLGKTCSIWYSKE